MTIIEPTPRTPGVVLQPSSVVVVEATREHEVPYAAADWPCPVCGQRKPTAGSWLLQVRNRAGPALQRKVQVCADCASRLGVERTRRLGRR